MKRLSNVTFSGERTDKKEKVIGKLVIVDFGELQPDRHLMIANEDGNNMVDPDTIDIYDEDARLYDRLNAMYVKLAEHMSITEQQARELMPWANHEVLDMLDSSFDNKTEGETKWVKTSETSLLAVKMLCAEEYRRIYVDADEFKRFCDDAAEGATFAFYWVEGKLRWEV